MLNCECGYRKGDSTPIDEYELFLCEKDRKELLATMGGKKKKQKDLFQ